MESYRKTGALERDDVYTAQSRAPARVVYLSVSYVFGIRRRNFFRLFGACKSDFRSEGNVYRTQKFVWGEKKKEKKNNYRRKIRVCGGEWRKRGGPRFVSTVFFLLRGKLRELPRRTVVSATITRKITRAIIFYYYFFFIKIPGKFETFRGASDPLNNTLENARPLQPYRRRTETGRPAA